MKSSRAIWMLLFWLCLSVLPASTVAWVRILSGDADPVTWGPGSPWPDRRPGMEIAPSALLSYATLSPGEQLDEAELARRLMVWQRALTVSGRFSRASVCAVDLEDADAPETSERVGIIVEAEPPVVPGFGGGAAYASIEFPLFLGRRRILAAVAGANRAGLSYRDDALFDAPLAFEASLRYDNDLLSSGSFAGNRLAGSLGFGPRLGPWGDLLLRCRLLESLDAYRPLLATDLALELFFPAAFACPSLDLGFDARASLYPGSRELVLSASPRLWLERGALSLRATAEFRFSSEGIDERELLASGEGGLGFQAPLAALGPFARVVSLKADSGLALLRWNMARWLEASLGPFVLAQAASADGEPIGALGGGLRLRLAPPVGVQCDLGAAIDISGEWGLVFDVSARPTM